MNETLSTGHKPTIEAAEADYDALVDMHSTLSAEEIDTFNELVSYNRTVTQQAKQLGSRAFNEAAARPRTDFAETLTANRENALESDAIFYGNTVKRK